EYESTNSNKDENSDDNFIENNDVLDNNRGINSIIDHLLAASKASIKRYCNRKLKITSFFFTTNTQLLVIDDNEDIGDHSFSDREYSDSKSEDEESLINNAIKFVNKILNEKMVSKTERTHYTAVLYFLRLLLDCQGKIEASETVVKVVNDGELILPSLREKMPIKSLVHNEFVFFQLAAYLQSQKFNTTPELVKNYLDQHILSQLNIRPLNNNEKEHVWITYDESTFYAYDRPHSVWGLKWEQPLQKKGLESCVHISDFLTETVESLKDSQEQAHIMMVLGCVGVFAFDNATSHTAFAKDALVASKMNLSLEGSALKIRDTIWNGNHQSMVIKEDYFVYDKIKKVNVNLRS
ncbi:14348_t:CDS:2, partial [Cetraspora pellucida]